MHIDDRVKRPYTYRRCHRDWASNGRGRRRFDIEIRSSYDDSDIGSHYFRSLRTSHRFHTGSRCKDRSQTHSLLQCIQKSKHRNTWIDENGSSVLHFDMDWTYNGLPLPQHICTTGLGHLKSFARFSLFSFSALDFYYHRSGELTFFFFFSSRFFFRRHPELNYFLFYILKNLVCRRVRLSLKEEVATKSPLFFCRPRGENEKKH